MKTRTDLLNHLATKYNLNSYLELGVQNPAQNFNKIVCRKKISVDPDLNADATFCVTSDMFFDKIAYDLGYKDNKFDLIFIDGLHTAEQVKKDFENALSYIKSNGFIVLHDCNPLKEEHTIVPRPKPTGHWNGDVYKFAMSIFLTNKFTVDIDNGCMVIPYTSNFDYLRLAANHWEHFTENRKTLLNLISWDEFVKL